MALPATRKSKRKTLWQMRKPWVPRSRSRVCELCPVQSIIEYCGKLIGILRYSFGCCLVVLGFRLLVLVLLLDQPFPRFPGAAHPIGIRPVGTVSDGPSRLTTLLF